MEGKGGGGISPNFPAFVPLLYSTVLKNKGLTQKNIFAGYFLLAHHRCEEEPQQSHVHQLRQVVYTLRNPNYKFCIGDLLRAIWPMTIFYSIWDSYGSAFICPPDPYSFYHLDPQWNRNRILIELESWIPRIGRKIVWIRNTGIFIRNFVFNSEK